MPINVGQRSAASGGIYTVLQQSERPSRHAAESPVLHAHMLDSHCNSWAIFYKNINCLRMKELTKTHGWATVHALWEGGM